MGRVRGGVRWRAARHNGRAGSLRVALEGHCLRSLARSTGLDVHTDASLVITSAGVSQQALGQQQDRHYLFIQNADTVNLYVDWGKAATLGYPSVVLLPGDNLTEEGNFVSGEAVSVISSKPGHQVVIRTGGGTP